MPILQKLGSKLRFSVYGQTKIKNKNISKNLSTPTYKIYFLFGQFVSLPKYAWNTLVKHMLWLFCHFLGRIFESLVPSTSSWTKIYQRYWPTSTVGWLRSSIFKISRNTKFWRNYFEFRENKFVDFREIFAKIPINFAKFSQNTK